MTHTDIVLLPCPFCGGEAEEHYNGEYRYIACNACHARGEKVNVRKLLPGQNNIDAYRIASEKWNTRFDPNYTTVATEKLSTEYTWCHPDRKSYYYQLKGTASKGKFHLCMKGGSLSSIITYDLENDSIKDGWYKYYIL